MTKSDEPVPTLLAKDTDPIPHSGWLNKVSLPIRPTGTAASPRSKGSQAFNALADVWQNCLRRHQPTNYHKPVTSRERFILADFGRCIGDQGREVIEFAIVNWKTFVSDAERKKGLFGSQPAEPSIRFFAKYHDCAVNLLWQSIADKKQQEEMKARMLDVKAKALPPTAPANLSPIQEHIPATKEQVEAVMAEYYAEIEQSKKAKIKPAFPGE